MDGLETPYLKWFRKKIDGNSDHRLYCDGAFTIAYDGVNIVEGACDIEVDVTYAPSATVGHINGQISALHDGPELSGGDFAAVFNNEHDNNQWRATITSFSPTLENDLFAVTIRLEAQPVARHVASAAPQALTTVPLEAASAGLYFDEIPDAGGGHVCAVRKEGAPLGALPTGVAAASVTEYWTLGATLVEFAAQLSLAYDTNAVPSPARLRVFRRADASSPWEAANVAAVAGGVATVTNVTHFSDWIVALGDEIATLPADLPGNVTQADRNMYLAWIEANKTAWGQADFSAMPAMDFMTAWLVGMQPATGFAAGLGLTITAFEPVAAQPAASNGMPLAWNVNPASKPAVARVAAELRSGASPVSGTVNGNLAIVSAEDLDGTWTTDVGQVDGNPRFTFDANGRAEMFFSPPANRRFFRAVLSREGRGSGTVPLRDWNASATSLWVTCTVDTVPTNGLHSSLAFNTAGVLGIAYYDSLAKDLKYASYDGTTLSVERVDTAGDVGQDCSLAFGTDGHPAISYYDATSRALKYAAFDGSQWVIETVDSSGPDAGNYTSLKFSPGGYPAVSYQRYDAASKVELCYASKDTAGWTLTTVADQLNSSIIDTSLAFGTNGYPSIAYYVKPTYGSYDIRYARWDGSAWLKKGIDYGCGFSLSLAFQPNGKAAVAYFDWYHSPSELVYVTEGTYSWSYWDSQTVAVQAYGTSAYPSLAFAPDGHPAISYHDDQLGYLKYAKYDGTKWSIVIVDFDGFVGAYSSLAFSPDGCPVISYYDATRGVLKLAEWVEGIRRP